MDVAAPAAAPAAAASSVVRRCLNCGVRNGNGVKLRLCARCRRVYFCGMDCARGLWNVHRNDCLAARSAPAADAAPAAAPAPDGGDGSGALTSRAAGPMPTVAELQRIIAGMSADDTLVRCTSDLIVVCARDLDGGGGGGQLAVSPTTGRTPGLVSDLQLLKRAANAAFVAGDMEAALVGYDEIVSLFVTVPESETLRPLSRLNVALACALPALEELCATALANRAQALLNQARHVESALSCLLALELPSVHEAAPPQPAQQQGRGQHERRQRPAGRVSLLEKVLHRLSHATRASEPEQIDAAAQRAAAEREASAAPSEQDVAAVRAPVSAHAPGPALQPHGHAPHLPSSVMGEWSREAAARLLRVCAGSVGTALLLRRSTLPRSLAPPFSSQPAAISQVLSALRDALSLHRATRLGRSEVGALLSELGCVDWPREAAARRARLLKASERAELRELAQLCAGPLHRALVEDIEYMGRGGLLFGASAAAQGHLDEAVLWLKSERDEALSITAFLSAADALMPGFGLESVSHFTLRFYAEARRGGLGALEVALMAAAGRSDIDVVALIDAAWVQLCDARALESAAERLGAELAAEQLRGHGHPLEADDVPVPLPEGHSALSEVDGRVLLDGSPRPCVPLRSLVRDVHREKQAAHWRGANGLAEPPRCDDGVRVREAAELADAEVDDELELEDEDEAGAGAPAAARAAAGAPAAADAPAGGGGASAPACSSASPDARARLAARFAALAAEPEARAALEHERAAIARDAGAGSPALDAAGAPVGPMRTAGPWLVACRAQEQLLRALLEQMSRPLPLAHSDNGGEWHVSFVPASACGWRLSETTMLPEMASLKSARELKVGRVEVVTAAGGVRPRRLFEPGAPRPAGASAPPDSAGTRALAVVSTRADPAVRRRDETGVEYEARTLAHAVCRALLLAVAECGGRPRTVRLGTHGAPALHSANLSVPPLWPPPADSTEQPAMSGSFLPIPADAPMTAEREAAGSAEQPPPSTGAAGRAGAAPARLAQPLALWITEHIGAEVFTAVPMFSAA